MNFSKNETDLCNKTLLNYMSGDLKKTIENVLELTENYSGSTLASSVYKVVFSRPDIMVRFVDEWGRKHFYINNFGIKRSKTIHNAIRKAIRKNLVNLTREDFESFPPNSERISMRDIIRICRPNPNHSKDPQIFEDIMQGNL